MGIRKCCSHTIGRRGRCLEPQDPRSPLQLLKRSPQYPKGATSSRAPMKQWVHMMQGGSCRRHRGTMSVVPRKHPSLSLCSAVSAAQGPFAGLPMQGLMGGGAIFEAESLSGWAKVLGCLHNDVASPSSQFHFLSVPSTDTGFLINIQHTSLYPGIFRIKHHRRNPWVYQWCRVNQKRLCWCESWRHRLHLHNTLWTPVEGAVCAGKDESTQNDWILAVLAGFRDQKAGETGGMWHW